MPTGFESMATAGSLQYLPSAAAGATVTPNAVAWTNSAYGQIVASAASDLVLLAVLIKPPNWGSNVEFEIDVATGGAGSEVVIATVVGSIRFSTSFTNGRLVLSLPIDNIPSGSRVAVRLRKVGTSVTTTEVSIEVASKPLGGSQSTTTNPSLPLPSAAAGTVASVNTNLGAWVNGAWAQITASTADALVLAGIEANIQAGSSGDFEFDIGTGGAGSEVVVTTFRMFNPGAGSGLNYLPLRPLLDNIASGVRVAVRVRCSLSGLATESVNVKLNYYAKTSLGSVSNVLGTKPLLWAPSAATGATLTYGGSAWANGAYAELIASTSGAIQIAAIETNNAATSDREIDIATGGAGSEVSQTTLRCTGGSGTASDDLSPVLPCPIDLFPTATRISARMRNSALNVSAIVVAVGYYAALDATLKTTVPTASLPAAANAVTITPNGTAWNNSSWVALTSGLGVTAAIAWLHYVTFPVTAKVEIDIGIGAAGSEIVQQTISGYLNTNGNLSLRIVLPLVVPASTRIALRMRKDGTSTSVWTWAATYYSGVVSPSSYTFPALTVAA